MTALWEWTWMCGNVVYCECGYCKTCSQSCGCVRGCDCDTYAQAAGLEEDIDIKNLIRLSGESIGQHLKKGILIGNHLQKHPTHPSPRTGSCEHIKALIFRIIFIFSSVYYFTFCWQRPVWTLRFLLLVVQLHGCRVSSCQHILWPRPW